MKVASGGRSLTMPIMGALLTKMRYPIVELPPDFTDPRHPYEPEDPAEPRVPNPKDPSLRDDEKIYGIKSCSMNMQPDKDLGGYEEGNEEYQKHNRNPFYYYGQEEDHKSSEIIHTDGK